MDKFLEVKEATRNAVRSSSVDARQTPRVKSRRKNIFINRNIYLLSPMANGQFNRILSSKVYY